MSCPVIELTQQLIRRPSLSPDDAGCQALLIERLQAIGFTVERMDFADTQNFWAWRGQGETLAFAGHTDVVPPGDADRWINPPFEPTIRSQQLCFAVHHSYCALVTGICAGAAAIALFFVYSYYFSYHNIVPFDYYRAYCYDDIIHHSRTNVCCFYNKINCQWSDCI